MKKLIFALLLTLLSASAHGEVIIRVFQKKQMLNVIQNNQVVFSDRVTTGKSSHRTPNGTFYIHSRSANAISAKYSAKMPNALFFIKTKYAIHAGKIMPYPASHGCVRVSYATSVLLFNMIDNGTKVVISN